MIKKYKNKEADHFAAFYDKYADVIYGLIVRTVESDVIAEKIFLRVIRDAFIHKNMEAPKLVSTFIAVTNHARKRSLETNKAIQIFRACNEGRACIIAGK